MEQVRTPADLGALARAARMARGWSQEQAAEAAGVSRRFVNMLEGGQHLNAEVWRVLALLNALGVTLQGTVLTAASGTGRMTPTASVTVAGRGTVGDPAAADDFDLDAHLDAFRREGD